MNPQTDDILLTESEIEFLKIRFNTNDSDWAVEQFIEYLTLANLDPLDMKFHVERMIRKYQC